LRQLGRYIVRDKLTLFFAMVLIGVVLIAIFAGTAAGYDPVEQSLLSMNEAPSAEHWLGTDQFGRDVWARVVYGSRTSLILGLVGPVLAALIGTTFGLIGGYLGGWTDRLLGRLVDLLLAFPALLLGILVAAALSSGFWSMVAVLTIAFAPRFARIARAATLSIASRDFVEAARSIGAGSPRIVLRHLLPNLAPVLIVLSTLDLGAAVLFTATLSFLGLGAQPPTPEWGAMLSTGRSHLTGAWWLATAPGVAILLTSLAFNLLGDGLRDVLDPRAD